MTPTWMKLPLAAAASALSLAGGAQGQNFSYPGPAWNEADYATSPPVYPSRTCPSSPLPPPRKHQVSTS